MEIKTVDGPPKPGKRGPKGKYKEVWEKMAESPIGQWVEIVCDTEYSANLLRFSARMKRGSMPMATRLKGSTVYLCRLLKSGDSTRPAPTEPAPDVSSVEGG